MANFSKVNCILNLRSLNGLGGKSIGNKEWNMKPPVLLDVFRLAGKFDLGLSGSPVFFPINNKVVGMFTAKEEDYGDVIPIETILQKFLDIVPNVPKEISLFLSKPSNKNLNSDQVIMLDKLKEVLKSNGIGTNFLEPEYYSKDKPIQKVRNVLEKCHGVIIVGFKQVHISNGIAKRGSESSSKLKDVFLPTRWNDIEAALAFANDIPILVISEEGVSGGIFDPDMTEFPMYWIKLPSTDWWLSQRFVQMLKKWFDEVIGYQKKLGQ